MIDESVSSKPDKVTIPTQDELDAARSDAAWLRYSASALIVGGSTVTLTLILASTAVNEQAYFALVALSGLLISAVSAFTWRIYVKMRFFSPISKDFRIVIFSMPVIFIWGVTTLPENWPLKPDTLPWWFLVGYSFGLAIFGAAQRQSAESKMEMISSCAKTVSSLTKSTSDFQSTMITWLESPLVRAHLARGCKICSTFKEATKVLPVSDR